MLGSVTRTRAIGTGNIVAATAFLVMASVCGATPATAHTEQYYTPHICQATDAIGEPTAQILFQGVAVNNHGSNTYILKCPVPYLRDTGDLSAIRVRLRASDRHSQKSVLLRICEVRDSNASVICPIAAQAQSGVGFDGGLVTLEAVFFPSAATRWILLDIHIPDVDAQTGSSFVVGYRVCRGNC